MNNDNSNLIEPTPEVLSRELSIHHNLPQQMTQEKEEEANENEHQNEEEEEEVDEGENENKNEKEEKELEIIEVRGTSIIQEKQIIDSTHNIQQKDSQSNSNSIKPHDITTSSHNHNNNNNPILNHTNNNNQITPKAKTPKQQQQKQKQSTITKQKNFKSAHPSTLRTEVNIYDIQGLSYRYNKELSRIIIPKEEAFMNRMLFDIFKRKEKESKINQLIEDNKVKLKETERKKRFNRLINDANRRLEVKEHLEENKNLLNTEENAFDPKAKKYKDDEWQGIYNERFIKFQSEKEKKQIENVKIKKDQERKNEEEVIELCKSKKAPMEMIKLNAQRMYDDVLKKRLLKNDQIAQKEKLNKKDSDMRKQKDDLEAKQQNRKKMRKNLEILLKDDTEDEEDLRSVPNPTCQTEAKKKTANSNQPTVVNVNQYLLNKNNEKDDTNAKYHKLNEKEFFKPSSRLHCDEREAEEIVKEFFTNKLMKH